MGAAVACVPSHGGDTSPTTTIRIIIIMVVAQVLYALATPLSVLDISHSCNNSINDNNNCSSSNNNNSNNNACSSSACPCYNVPSPCCWSPPCAPCCPVQLFRATPSAVIATMACTTLRRAFWSPVIRAL